MAEGITYQIRVTGHLDRQWTDWFGGLAITQEEDGHTLLTGLVIDQAALYGLLKKVRDLGLPLVSVNPVEPSAERSRGVSQPDVPEVNRDWPESDR